MWWNLNNEQLLPFYQMIVPSILKLMTENKFLRGIQVWVLQIFSFSVYMSIHAWFLVYGYADFVLPFPEDFIHYEYSVPCWNISLPTPAPILLFSTDLLNFMARNYQQNHTQKTGPYRLFTDMQYVFGQLWNLNWVTNDLPYFARQFRTVFV